MFTRFKAKRKQSLGEQEAKKVADTAIDLVVRYGKICEGLGTAIADTSRLPVPKAEMKTALKLAWRFAEDNQRMQSWTETGYVLLANFQDDVGPEPIDCKLSPNADAANAAAALEPWLKWSPQVQAEMNELVAEFDAFKRALARRPEHTAISVEIVNTYAAKWTVFGWFAGLAYYNWFASNPVHIPFLGHVLLVTVGMFAASIIIGGGMAIVAAVVTRLITGNAESHPDFFAWAAFISPVLAFFAASPALRFVAAI